MRKNYKNVTYEYLNRFILKITIETLIKNNINSLRLVRLNY